MIGRALCGGGVGGQRICASAGRSILWTLPLWTALLAPSPAWLSWAGRVLQSPALRTRRILVRASHPNHSYYNSTQYALMEWFPTKSQTSGFAGKVIAGDSPKYDRSEGNGSALSTTGSPKSKNVLQRRVEDSARAAEKEATHASAKEKWKSARGKLGMVTALCVVANQQVKATKAAHGRALWKRALPKARLATGGAGKQQQVAAKLAGGRWMAKAKASTEAKVRNAARS